VVITIDILELVDRLELLINEGWRVPFSAKTVVNDDVFFDIVDQMRISIPEEVKRAKELLQDRENVLAEATKNAERVVDEAQGKAARLVDEHDITTSAQAEADRIKAEAEREAAEIRKGADDYAMGVLSELESRLSSLLRLSSNGLKELQRRRRQQVSEEAQEAS
jgi:vacuolar-type H+-ATPase subunit H